MVTKTGCSGVPHTEEYQYDGGDESPVDVGFRAGCRLGTRQPDQAAPADCKYIRCLTTPMSRVNRTRPLRVGGRSTASSAAGVQATAAASLEGRSGRRGWLCRSTRSTGPCAARSGQVPRTVVTQLCYWPLLLRELRHADVVHVFSASYFSFLLAPLPAVLIAKLLGKPVVMNYRSGQAPDHLQRSAIARATLRWVERNAVPSRVLQGVFA